MNFGYPKCCVKMFTSLRIKIGVFAFKTHDFSPQQLCALKMTKHFGFVPCHNCAVRMTDGSLSNLRDLFTDRPDVDVPLRRAVLTVKALKSRITCRRFHLMRQIRGEPALMRVSKHPDGYYLNYTPSSGCGLGFVSNLKYLVYTTFENYQPKIRARRDVFVWHRRYWVLVATGCNTNRKLILKNHTVLSQMSGICHEGKIENMFRVEKGKYQLIYRHFKRLRTVFE